MATNKNWFRIKNVERLDSPALIVHADRVARNIQTAISMIGEVSRLRPHVKTNKSGGAIKMLLDAGISKFKCATIAEAELLGRLAAKDVLLAYQPGGPKLNRFIQLIKKYPNTSFSCLTDNLSSAKEQSTAFSSSNLNVDVYIDINVGMNRTGIKPNKGALELYKFLGAAPGIKAAGLHVYDGHIRDVDLTARTLSCNAAFETVERLQAEIEADGLYIPNIIAGGSPSFPIHAQRKNVECSPGTFIYWDQGYVDGCPEQDFLPAAVLLTRVISVTSANGFTTDLGHKSVAAENEIGKRVSLLTEDELQVAGQSEEHLVVHSEKDHHYKVGDVLYGLPFHVCPTVALYERVHLVMDGTVTGEWFNEARDRRLTDGV